MPTISFNCANFPVKFQRLRAAESSRWTSTFNNVRSCTDSNGSLSDEDRSSKKEQKMSWEDTRCSSGTPCKQNCRSLQTSWIGQHGRVLGSRGRKFHVSENGPDGYAEFGDQEIQWTVSGLRFHMRDFTAHSSEPMTSEYSNSAYIMIRNKGIQTSYSKASITFDTVKLRLVFPRPLQSTMDSNLGVVFF